MRVVEGVATLDLFLSSSASLELQMLLHKGKLKFWPWKGWFLSNYIVVSDSYFLYLFRWMNWISQKCQNILLSSIYLMAAVSCCMQLKTLCTTSMIRFSHYVLYWYIILHLKFYFSRGPWSAPGSSEWRWKRHRETSWVYSVTTVTIVIETESVATDNYKVT